MLDYYALRRHLTLAPIDWLNALVKELPLWNINTPDRQASFLGQFAHESKGFTVFEENLNYSATTLVKVWPHRFWLPSPQESECPEGKLDARNFVNRPEPLANVVYANRLGNGNVESGDGWMFRGRGPAQLTFRDNYLACGAGLREPLEQVPELLLEPEIGVQSACWYWNQHHLSDLADLGSLEQIEGITHAINGGLNGLTERRSWTEIFLHTLLSN